MALRIWGEKKWRDETLRTNAAGTTTFELEQPLDPEKPVGSVTVHAKGFALDGRNIKSATMEFALKPGATWRGLVVDETGAPIAGAQVRATALWPPKNEKSSYLFPFGDEIIAAYSARTDA